MDGGPHTEIVIAGMLAAVAALVTLARVLGVPYPIFLVLGGLGLGFLPGVPRIELEPELVLLIFLPPLLYSAAFFASLRDLRRNARPITLLSVGLVLATCGAVAVVVHAVVPGLSWEAAFVLGAIVSPTDPVAATAIAGRLGVPRRVVVVVEGESLVNDATAITAYRVAVVALASGTFSATDAGGRFLLGALGGAAIGLAVGWVIAAVRERLDDPPVELTISLLTAYAAYLPAEELGLSGVIAAVTVGLYMGSQTSRVTNAQTRMQGFAMWQILTFLLNSFLFVLIGLQLPQVLDELREADYPTGTVLLYGLWASLTVVAVRVAWVYAFTYLPRRLIRRVGERDPTPPWRNVTLVAWMGMRGAVSLAAALAVPVATDAGRPIEERPLILFITFAVILFTLVVQGLSLPFLIRLLGVEPEDDDVVEENKARKLAARAALDRIDELEREQWTRDDTIERMRGLYRYRYDRFAARFDADGDGDAIEDRTATYLRMVAAVIEAQRDALEDLRHRGVISDEVMRRVERELDLEEGRMLG
jgi:CPA1 family monovalent cation:H+ antiporter